MFNALGPIPDVKAQDYRLPAPGVMVHLSPAFDPPILKGMKVHPDDPFRFDFILDKGDGHLSSVGLKAESSRLIKYFLASLTIPEKYLWVNLSPYEKDRIIPNSFGLTEMGRDLLAEDYMLKQITASLIYPQEAVGRKFWKRIYEEAQKRYGTTQVPVNTFNKVWIVPQKAVVYENAKAGTAYVVESRLKVMLEQDYLSLEKHEAVQSRDLKDAMNGVTTNQLGSQIVREIVIPELTTEVNENKNFAHLRQVYNSLILATWYKKKIKDSILSQVYADKRRVAGVGIDDPQEKEKIYQRYIQAFKKGVYNYIKEEAVSPGLPGMGREILPRKYFSGGLELKPAKVIAITDQMPSAAMIALDHAMLVNAVLFARFSPHDGPSLDGNDPGRDVSAAMVTDRSIAAQESLLKNFQKPVFLNHHERDLFAGAWKLSWVSLTDEYVSISFVERNSRKLSAEFWRPAKSILSSVYRYTLPEDITIEEMFKFMESVRNLDLPSAEENKVFSVLSEKFKQIAVSLARSGKGSESARIENVKLFYSLAVIMKQGYVLGVVKGLKDQEILEHVKNQQVDDVIPESKIVGWLKMWDQDVLDLNDLVAEALEKAVQGVQINLEHFLYMRGLKLLADDFVKYRLRNFSDGVILGKGVVPSNIEKPGRAAVRRFKDELAVARKAWEDARRGESESVINFKKEFLVHMEELVIGYLLEKISSLPGWIKGKKHQNLIEASPRYGRQNFELNCVGRSALMGKLLEDFGFTVFAILYKDHISLLCRCADGSYYVLDPSGKGVLNKEKIILPMIDHEKNFMGGAFNIPDLGGRVFIIPWQEGVLASFYNNWAGELADAKDYLAAVNAYKKSLSLGDTMVRSGLGNVLFEQAKTEVSSVKRSKLLQEAIFNLNEYLEVYPSPESYALKGEILLAILKQGSKPEEKIKLLTDIISVYEKAANMNEKINDEQVNSGRIKADEFYKRVLDFEQAQRKYYTELSNALEQMADLQESETVKINLLERALAAYKESGSRLDDNYYKMSGDLNYFKYRTLTKSGNVQEMKGLLDDAIRAYQQMVFQNARVLGYLSRALKYKSDLEDNLKYKLILLVESREALEMAMDKMRNKANAAMSVKNFKSTGAAVGHEGKVNGGIDLTFNDSLQARSAGAGIKFHLNSFVLKYLQHVSGFVPVIINIQPLKSLPEFLGLNASRA